MGNLETVESSVKITDPLISLQNEDVAKMRASLLAFSAQPTTAVQAIQEITVLRVYHQIARIIKYLDMMDKIEAKLYDALEIQLDKMSEADPSTWMMLLNIQERLQKNMIESHKLLQPYLNVDEMNIMDSVVTSTATELEDNTVGLLSRSSRDKVRASAQKVLEVLEIEEAS